MPTNKFYITTPIYYSNDEPHLGHLSTTIYADILTKYKKELGFKTLFLTGNDEHGEKVYLEANKSKIAPQTFVDDMAKKWRGYWKKMEVQPDIFMRTSNPKHKEIVSTLLTKIKNNGDIYKGVYRGIYCVGCEEFKTEKQLMDGKCPEHRPDQVSYKEEENYFFKLSKYIPQITKLLKSGELSLETETWRKEIISRLEGEKIQDLSISRANVSWGIELPWDPKHTVYVWVEALMNYFTATIIYKKESFYPANVHFLGKGNNWFHSVIWPALLLSLDIDLPKNIFVHGYYNVEGKKMGKSLGNVIKPNELIEKYGVEGTRYLLCATMPYNKDSDVSYQLFNDIYNSHLANGIGNLARRLSTLAKGSNLVTKIDFKNSLSLNNEIKNAYESYNLTKVCEEVKKQMDEINQKIAKTEPWNIKEKEKKDMLLKELVEDFLKSAILLKPVLPDTWSKIEESLSNKEVQQTEVLFSKLN